MFHNYEYFKYRIKMDSKSGCMPFQITSCHVDYVECSWKKVQIYPLNIRISCHISSFKIIIALVATCQRQSICCILWVVPWHIFSFTLLFINMYVLIVSL